MTAMSDEHAWLIHPDIGIPWQCPIGAIGLWTARGWEPCDAPDEPDVTKDAAAVAPEPEPTPVPAEPDKPKSKRATEAALTTEGAE